MTDAVLSQIHTTMKKRTRLQRKRLRAKERAKRAREAPAKIRALILAAMATGMRPVYVPKAWISGAASVRAAGPPHG